jgi:septation ring formation regulator EzrA
METTIRISPNELTPEWLKKIKALFENENELQITIKPLKQKFLVNENQEEYVTRVNNAIEKLESGTDVISLLPSDLDKLSDELLSKK